MVRKEKMTLGHSRIDIYLKWETESPARGKYKKKKWLDLWLTLLNRTQWLNCNIYLVSTAISQIHIEWYSICWSEINHMSIRNSQIEAQRWHSTADIIKSRRVNRGRPSCFIKTCFSDRDMSQPAFVRAIVSQGAATSLHVQPSKIWHTHFFSPKL